MVKENHHLRADQSSVVSLSNDHGLSNLSLASHPEGARVTAQMADPESANLVLWSEGITSSDPIALKSGVAALLSASLAPKMMVRLSLQYRMVAPGSAKANRVYLTVTQ